jgi:MFS family permease
MYNQKAISRKITTVLFAQQSLASAGFIAASTLNAIVAAKLAGHASWAGVPSAVYLFGGALAAFAWGHIFDLIGRRNGLVGGLVIGAVGSGTAFYAISHGSFALFMPGMAMMGIANAAVQLGRFAAAEVNPPDERGRAISNVVIGGTIGSILGPLMAGPAGQIIKPLSGDELAGAYLVGTLLFAVGAVVVFLGLRPDPREIGRELAAHYPESAGAGGPPRSVLHIFRQPAAAVALLAMVLGQMVMVLVMVITSLHMRDHNHMLGEISIVISAHTFGMYAFSAVSGQLVDRWGRGPVIMAGAAALVLACLAATISPDVIPLGAALFMLGLGWNFCYVGGSTLLADQLTPLERARTQGFNDLLVGLAAAAGSVSSGLVFAALGYDVMAFISAGLALLPLGGAAAWSLSRMRLRPAPSAD